MSLKFTGGVSKTLGSVNAGSREVSCRIEIELDKTSSNDPDDIQRQVEQAFAACRRAVKDELARNVKTGV